MPSEEALLLNAIRKVAGKDTYNQATDNLEALYDAVKLVSQVGLTGNVIHVATVGSDATGDGSANSPYKTIDYAVGKCTSDNNDWIIVHPGTYTENVNLTGVDVDVATIHFLGVGGPTEDAHTLVSPVIQNNGAGSNSVFAVTVPRIEFINLKIVATANTQCGIWFMGGSAGCVVRKCHFGALLIAAILVDSNEDFYLIEDSYFEDHPKGVIKVTLANFVYVRRNTIVKFGTAGAGDYAIEIAAGNGSVIEQNVINGNASALCGGIKTTGGMHTVVKNIVTGCVTPWLDPGVSNYYEANIGGIRAASFTYLIAGGEQTVLDDLTMGKSGPVRFTIYMGAVAGATTVTTRIYEKVDGINYAEVAEVTSPAMAGGITMPTAVAYMRSGKAMCRVTMQLSVAANVIVPYVFAEVV